MQPINFDGATIIKSNGEDNCMHMYAQQNTYKVPVHTVGEDGKITVEEYDAVYWRELWKPSEKDIENILAGRGVWLDLHCRQLIPVAVFTTDEDGDIEEPNFDEQLTPKD